MQELWAWLRLSSWRDQRIEWLAEADTGAFETVFYRV